MSLLKRETILGMTRLPYETVLIPEWGGDVCVRGMTGRERDAIEQQVVSPEGKRKSIDNFRARVAVMCVVDEQGKRVFSNADVEALGTLAAAALTRVFEVALRLSGLSPTDVADLEKNSDSGQSEDSTSG